jgi:hypothetical protein
MRYCTRDAVFTLAVNISKEYLPLCGCAQTNAIVKNIADGGLFGGAVNRNSVFNCFYFLILFLHTTTCLGPYGPSSGGIYTVTYGSYYPYNGFVLGYTIYTCICTYIRIYTIYTHIYNSQKRIRCRGNSFHKVTVYIPPEDGR